MESSLLVPAGNCAAAGTYGYPYGSGYVVSETNGVWGKAVNVPGLKALNTGGDAEVPSVSCAAARSCAAGRYYTPSRAGFSSQGFVTE